MFVVEFVPGAARQTARARDWWFENRDKAPHAFDEDMAELLTMLEHLPHAAGVAVAQRPGVRRAILRRARYNVYFTVEEATVTIIAVWHSCASGSPGLGYLRTQPS